MRCSSPYLNSDHRPNTRQVVVRFVATLVMVSLTPAWVGGWTGAPGSASSTIEAHPQIANEPDADKAPLRLASATGPDDSGLLEELLPHFTEQTGVRVQVIAVGTGKALRLGQAGDVDVLLVHAPEQELAFVAAGFGTLRTSVMVNEFVLVGPQSNPARLGSDMPAHHALTAIAKTNSRFVSRADASGTHAKEEELWRTAHTTPQGSWYLEAGRGMASVLQMANELGAYTLTDRGTWIALRSRLPTMTVLNQGDPAYHNPYSLIAVNPERHSRANYANARRFIRWFSSAPTQARIGAFAIDGETLFQPVAPSSE